jgi:hypothetical protein
MLYQLSYTRVFEPLTHLPRYRMVGVGFEPT